MTASYRRGPAPRSIGPEHRLQQSVVQWCDKVAAHGPLAGLRLFYAITNAGARSPQAAQYLRAEGLRPGMLDACLPLPRFGFGAAYLEHKVKPGRLSAEQIAFAWSLVRAGNAVRISYCFEDSQEFLTRYVTTGRVDFGVLRIPLEDMRALQLELNACMSARAATLYDVPATAAYA
jgi:hypothetical protein